LKTNFKGLKLISDVLKLILNLKTIFRGLKVILELENSFEPSKMIFWGDF